jgi:uncharacterized lipoprotein YmbA
MIGRAVIMAVLLLAGCAPEPRSASYFKAHHQEAAKVAAACQVGRSQGAECLNAEAGVNDARLDAEMAKFRKGF